MLGYNCIATGLEEGKLWIEVFKTQLKNRPPACEEGFGKYKFEIRTTEKKKCMKYTRN